MRPKVRRKQRQTNRSEVPNGLNRTIAARERGSTSDQAGRSASSQMDRRKGNNSDNPAPPIALAVPSH
jgi:hypothetical protein